ncbi:hypothetical protein BGZ49_005469, partial [Haplosporangium sp. Z 27]
AVHVLNSIRILTYKALNLFIVTHLATGSEGPNLNDLNPVDPLDMLLSQKHGRSIIRGLVTLIANGKFDGRGGQPKDEGAIKARSIAQDIFNRFKSLLGEFEPIKGEKYLTLTVAQKAMAHEMADDLRLHFRRLPSVIVGKMRACGFPDESIPNMDVEDEESPESTPEADEDSYDDDGDIDVCPDDGDSAFKAGHITKWWMEYSRLPNPSRPIFCPSSGFSDTFLTFSEEAIFNLLWGGGKKGTKHPTRLIVENLMPKAVAESLVKHKPGSLFFSLFIGNHQQVADRHGVRQTSYGRLTTTIETVTEPSSGHVELQLPNLRTHVQELFSYRSELSKRKESPELVGTDPPERPVLPGSESLRD